MTDIVGKALWFIEHRYAQSISLDDVAEHVGVSRFHLSRSFPAATGYSISAYLRGRRLTEAAKALAAGAPDILAVAIDAQYGSHEAFTRAFRDQFGLTPEQLRAQGSTEGLRLVEAIRLDDTLYVDLPPPEIRNIPPLLLAGLAERHAFDRPEEIPAQWQRFNPYIGYIPHMVDGAAYGVLSDLFFGEDSFQCLTAVEVRHLTDLQPELSAMRLPAQRYAVFQHDTHVAKMRPTVHTIFNRLVPELALELADIPNFIEYYGPRFDPESGLGGVEIWVPLKG